MLSNSLTGVSFEAHTALRPLVQEPSSEDDLYRCRVAGRVYKIRSADSDGQRSSASILIHRMYATRGYASRPLPEEAPSSRITLVASEQDATVATITVGFDSSDGLHVDALFATEIAALRQAGRRLCEFTTLAIDPLVGSRRLLASLFNVAYIHAHRVMGCDTLLIEINPRHVLYYERMLGFKVMAPQRHSPRVGAPAVLMGIDLSYIRAQGERLAGVPPLAGSDRSLYPYWFSPLEEEAIFRRLHRARVVEPTSGGFHFESRQRLQA